METRNLLIAMGVSGVFFSLVVAWGGVPSLSAYDLQLLFQKSSCKIWPKKKEHSYRSCLCSSGIWLPLLSFSVIANAWVVKLTSEALAGKRSKLKKKVRFAPDVVEPRFSNEECRRKGKSLVARTMSSSEENCRTSEKRMTASGTHPVKFQTLANPAKLPGNRTALNNSISFSTAAKSEILFRIVSYRF